ncbi:MAG: YIP1 family protein [Pseudomonadota bacterium]
MPVTRDIVAAHSRPRRVMARLLAMGQREDRALAMLMGACFIWFAAQWPWRAREAHLNDLDLTDLIQNDMFAMIFVLPLLAYGFAALTHLMAKPFGGQGDWYGARLALFWAMLASSPLIVLSGMVKGFIGPGVENTAVGALWFAVFLWIWLPSLWEAERP